MLDQPTVATDFDQLRQRAEGNIADGAFGAADATYAELQRLGGLTRADAGHWLQALRARPGFVAMPDPSPEVLRNFAASP